MKKQLLFVAALATVLLSVLTFTSCEGTNPQTDPRAAFIGDYSFVSTGEIEIYLGALKLITFPMNQEGELSILPGDKSNTVWVKAENDSTIAYISDNQLFMDPTEHDIDYGEVSLHLAFTYGKATLEDNQLTFTSEVEVSASYQSQTLSGSGTVDIVATKKSN